eukprot:6180190-Pleurochrysis_carterae.AAC.1
MVWGSEANCPRSTYELMTESTVASSRTQLICHTRHERGHGFADLRARARVRKRRDATLLGKLRIQT